VYVISIDRDQCDFAMIGWLILVIARDFEPSAEALNNETQMSSARFNTRTTYARKKREEKIEGKDSERRMRSRNGVSPRRRCDVRLRFKN